MRLSLLVLWCLVGVFRGRVPQLPRDIPERPPRPNWILLILGIVGGVVGGLVFTWAFGLPIPWLTAGPSPEPWMTAVPRPEPWMGVIFAAATTVGAFLGASLLADLYGLVRGGRATRG
jgi:H+/Cl- antiporter ClcA